MIYRARKSEISRTRFVLEIGNESDSIVWPAMDLPYLAKHYRLCLTRAELALNLVKSKFSAKLSWTSGVYLTNTVLDMSVPLPPKITVPFWKVTKLRSFLQIPHFVTVQILTDSTNCHMDIILLSKPQPGIQPTAPLYPILPSVSSIGANLPPAEQKH